MTDIIHAECPNCSAQLKVKGQQAIGKRVRCPKCEQPFVIQAPEPEEAAVDPDEEFLSLLNSAVASSSKRRGPSVNKVPRRVGVGPKEKINENLSRSSFDESENKEDVDRLGSVGWVVGGAIGGGIGAVIWASIGYSMGLELGWIAWGVGALAGIGVRAGASEAEGNGPGVTALVIALLSVMLGKFLIAWFICENFNKGVNKMFDPEIGAIAQIEEEVRSDFEKQGRKSNLLPDLEKGKDAKANAATYTEEEVATEAKKRWNAKTPEEQDEAKEEVLDELGDFGDVIGLTPGRLFLRLLFHPLTLLWFLLAGATAFKIGAGFEFGG